MRRKNTLSETQKENQQTLARRVFPQPGGPANKIPGGDVRPKAANCLGYRTGARIARLSSSRMSSRAPTSSHVTLGTVANPSRFADG